MATASPMPSKHLSDPNPDSVPSPNPHQKRRPLPLSAAQEQQVRDTYYKNVRAMCAEEIQAFAACARSRTFSATFLCRTERNAMNACMITHATQDNMDAARSEWFSKWQERRAAKEEEQRKKIEADKFHREWWGLDEQGRRRETHPVPEDAEHAKRLKEQEKELRKVGVSLERGRKGKE